MKKKIIGLALVLTGCIAAGAQQKDSLVLMGNTSMLKPGFSINDALVKLHERKQKIKFLIFPAVLITYGFAAQGSEELKEFDISIKNEIREDRPFFYTKIDNYL